MKCVAVVALVLLAAPALYSQTQAAAPAAQAAAPSSALLSNNDGLALLRRISQLMESTMVATPGMTACRRAAAGERQAGDGQH